VGFCIFLRHTDGTACYKPGLRPAGYHFFVSMQTPLHCQLTFFKTSLSTLQSLGLDRASQLSSNYATLERMSGCRNQVPDCFKCTNCLVNPCKRRNPVTRSKALPHLLCLYHVHDETTRRASRDLQPIQHVLVGT
jgi:hypothetical protein